MIAWLGGISWCFVVVLLYSFCLGGIRLNGFLIDMSFLCLADVWGGLPIWFAVIAGLFADLCGSWIVRVCCVA